MAYLSLYRKWRPPSFSGLVGQDHVARTLANSIKADRVAHAYLFAGPRGTGKTSTAKILAKGVNCQEGPTPEPCGRCPSCLEISAGTSLDVIEMDAASNRGIDEIRELRDKVAFAATTGRYKVYIIDEVHMLTEPAFNALLKTLEEPPAHVKFMFATTEPEKVLATILSRCQRFDLRRIPTPLIVKHLAYIAGLEKVKIDEPALYAIARGADGCMRDAESTLDQLISFCGGQIVEPDVLSMFGLAARGQILDLAGAILAGEIENTLRKLDELARNGKDLTRLLSDLLNHFRNLMLYQVTQGDLKFLEVSESEAVALAGQSASIQADALARVMEVLTECEGRLRDAASKRIMIEVSLVKAIQVRNAVSIDAVLKKLQQMRDGAGSIETALAPALSAPVAAPPAVRGEPVAPPVADSAAEAAQAKPAEMPARGNGGDLMLLWRNVIEAVGRVSPFARTYLLEAHPVTLVKNVFTIGFDPEFSDHIGLVDNSKNRTLIQTKLQELGCGEVHVTFIVAPATTDWVRPAAQDASASAPPPTEQPGPAPASGIQRRKTEPAPTPKEDLKNDPLIKQALEIFKGTIVEVRA